MGVHDAGVAADQGGERDRLRRGKGEVAAGTVEDLAVPAATPELGAGPVRDLAFKHGPEDVRIDRPFEPELLRALAEPGARLPVFRIVLRIVAVVLVIARALGGRAESPDREHVSPSPTGRSRFRRLRSLPCVRPVPAPSARACPARLPEAPMPARRRDPVRRPPVPPMRARPPVPVPRLPQALALRHDVVDRRRSWIALL